MLRFLYLLVNRLRAGSRPCDRLCTQKDYLRISAIAHRRGSYLPYWPSIAEARDLDLWFWGHNGRVDEMMSFVDRRRGLRRCRTCGCTDDYGCESTSLARSCHWVERDLCSTCKRYSITTNEDQCMSTATRLIAELKQARANQRKARDEIGDVKIAIAAKREAFRQASARVEEILEQMETGKSRTPLFDEASANGDTHKTPITTRRHPRPVIVTESAAGTEP